MTSNISSLVLLFLIKVMQDNGSSDGGEHDIGSGSSGGGEHKGEEMSTMPSQVTEAIPSGLGEMIPSLGQFSGSGPLP
ncbi:MAG: hypothetical protein WAL66_14480 [Nitrososphaeraceae archaeon]